MELQCQEILSDIFHLHVFFGTVTTPELAVLVLSVITSTSVVPPVHSWSSLDWTGPESSRFGLGNMWAQLPGIPAPLKHVVMC